MQPALQRARNDLRVCARRRRNDDEIQRRVVKSVDAEDIAGAVVCIEEAREDLAQRELAARTQHRESLLEAAHRKEQATISALERATAAEIAEREDAMRRELHEQQAAERRAQADAVARAIRRS